MTKIFSLEKRVRARTNKVAKVRDVYAGEKVPIYAFIDSPTSPVTCNVIYFPTPKTESDWSALEDQIVAVAELLNSR